MFGGGPNFIEPRVRPEGLGVTSEAVGEGWEEQADMFEGDMGIDGPGESKGCEMEAAGPGKPPT
jgi:hypothetical protein